MRVQIVHKNAFEQTRYMYTCGTVLYLVLHVYIQCISYFKTAQGIEEKILSGC